MEECILPSSKLVSIHSGGPVRLIKLIIDKNKIELENISMFLGW